MPIVRLGGNDYVTRGRIKRSSQEPFANAFRTVGIQQFQDIQTRSAVKFPVPILGFGLARITDVNDPKQFLRFWDSTLETRFGSQVTLPLLDQDATEPNRSGLGAMKMGVEHAGVLMGFWSQGTSPSEDIYLNSYSSGSWRNTDLRVTGSSVDGVSVLDAVVHKTRRFLLAATADDISLWSSSGAAATAWTIRGNPGTTTNWPNNQLVNNVTKDEQIDAGLLCDYGNTLLVAYWDEDNGAIAIVESTDNGATWANSLTTNIGSGNGPTGLCVFYDLDGNSVPVLGTREGLYAVDLTNNALTPILSLRPDNNNCRRMCVWKGDLYVPVGNGGILRVRYTGSQKVPYEVTSIGPDLGDGLPSDTQGHVTFMHPTDRWLFVAYSGHDANTQARILAYDGGDPAIPGTGWHNIYQHGTANREITWFTISNVGGTDILHVSVRTGTNSSDMRYFEKPLANSKSDSTIKVEASGALIRPEFDGGFPGINAAWLQVAVDAADLSTAITGEYINLDYGLDDGTVDTDLGNILSGDKDLSFGSGLGVSGISLVVQETYNRDAADNTQTPKGRTTEVTYLKRPGDLEAWAFTVDLKATADVSQVDVETVVSRLEALRPPTQIVLVAFLYGKMDSKNVIVEPLQWEETVDEESSPIRDEEREGLVTVVVREVV